jgi:hypothetical protein
MKKLLFLCMALLVVPASTAFAQIDLTWDNCILADELAGELPPSANKTWVCTGTAIQRNAVHGSYKSPIAIPDFIAMDISMDLQSDPPGTPLPCAYQYEVAPAAATFVPGFNVDNTIAGPGLGEGGCSLLGTLWGDAGADAGFAAITSVSSAFGGTGRRILAAVARSSENPIPLVAGSNYYGFHIRVTQNATFRNSCVGCSAPAVLVWNSATLYGRSGQIVVLAGPSNKGLGTSSANSYCAMINSANLATCVATPTRNTTWGRLKTIYR